MNNDDSTVHVYEYIFLLNDILFYIPLWRTLKIPPDWYCLHIYQSNSSNSFLKKQLHVHHNFCFRWLDGLKKTETEYQGNVTEWSPILFKEPYLVELVLGWGWVLCCLGVGQVGWEWPAGCNRASGSIGLQGHPSMCSSWEVWHILDTWIISWQSSERQRHLNDANEATN